MDMPFFTVPELIAVGAFVLGLVGLIVAITLKDIRRLRATLDDMEQWARAPLEPPTGPAMGNADAAECFDRPLLAYAALEGRVVLYSRDASSGSR